MSDMMAKCDWHDGTLSIVLPEDPERIAVRMFDSRYAPARLYVPEAEIKRLRTENAKLREQADFEHFQLEEMKKAAGMMLDDFVAVKNRNASLATEYAKLRKMLASIISNYVDGYMDDTTARYPCDLCDESSKQQCDYQHDRQCPFYKQLRELGVEVDR